jgi:hypothetical protein
MSYDKKESQFRNDPNPFQHVEDALYAESGPDWFFVFTPDGDPKAFKESEWDEAWKRASVSFDVFEQQCRIEGEWPEAVEMIAIYEGGDDFEDAKDRGRLCACAMSFTKFGKVDYKLTILPRDDQPDEFPIPLGAY